MLAARGAVDQQDGGPARRVVPALGLADRRARGKPIDRKLIVGVGEFFAGFLRVRGLATVCIGVPGGGGDAVELTGERPEGLVLELPEKSPPEFVLGQAWTGHSLARGRLGHAGFASR